MTMPTTLILSDSRGAKLGLVLANISHEEFKAFSFPGATMTELIFRSADYIRRFKPRLVIILGGINDMTILDKATRKVSIRFDSVEKCREHFTSIITHSRALLSREYPNVLFTFAGIIGMDMAKYNGQHVKVEDQKMMNDSILEVNRLLKYYNYQHDSPHKYFTTIVHRWELGVCHHSYELLYDGLHPRTPVLRHWIRQIFKLHAKIGGTVYNA